MLNLKLKQAKAAFADARLDEACDLIFAADLLAHRQGQKLAKKLASELTARGNGHLKARRIDSALADCSKAEKLAGNHADSAKLRADICKAIEENRFDQAKQQELIINAKANIDNGMVSLGREMLEKSPENAQALLLKQQASVIDAKTASVIKKANAAIERNDLDNAVKLLAQANLKPHTNTAAAETLARVTAKLEELIKETLNNGKLNHSADYINRLSTICPDSVLARDFNYTLAQCRIASESINTRDFSRATETLRRLKNILPNAKWIETAIKDARTAAQAIDDLMVCPLSMLFSHEQSPGLRPEIKQAQSYDLQKDTSLPYKPAREPLPKSFLMQIDGVGSYLVISDSPATIGPAGSSPPPLIGLMAQPNLPTAAIDRVEGDYFIRSKQPVTVNENTVTDKLLEDGDKISLSLRCRMKFNLPNVASSTAVISLASARLPNADTRNIILMDREILIGAGIKNHVRANQFNSQIALFKQNNRLLCRTDMPIEVDGKQYDPQKGLELNKLITIGKLSLVLKEI